jgi:hypothetical protein
LILTIFAFGLTVLIAASTDRFVIGGHWLPVITLRTNTTFDTINRLVLGVMFVDALEWRTLETIAATLHVLATPIDLDPVREFCTAILADFRLVAW